MNASTKSSKLARLGVCLNLSAVLAVALGASGCDLGIGAGTTAPEGPPKPEYERSFDEFADIPHQITVQVQWAAAPIDEAIALAEEIAALRAKLDIDAETFAGMCTVAFKDGTIEVGAVGEVEGAKAEIEATLTKIKAVGVSLQGIPGRVKTAGKAISQLAMSTPKLALSSGKELTGSLSVAVGDSKIQIEADLATVKKLPQDVKKEAKAAKDVLTELPNKAKLATQNLFAAMKGEPVTPMETSAPPAGEGEQATGGAGVVADAGAGAGTDAAAGTGDAAPISSAGAPPPSTGMMQSEVVAASPPAIIAARIAVLESEAMDQGERGDWYSASLSYEEAYRLDPKRLLLEFSIADAASRAKQCDRSHDYFSHFVDNANQTTMPQEIQAAKKTMGELKTFDCPERTPDEEAAVAQTHRLRAESLAAENDWGGAAEEYYVAFMRTPDDAVFAYEVGVASWKAHECRQAVDYFYHFTDIGDPRTHRRQLREAKRYIDKSEAGECTELGAGGSTFARELYAQAQSRELALDFMGAAGKYQRAYALLPDNHALDLRVAESLWGAQLCAQADPHYRNFVAKAAGDDRLAEDLQRAQGILARIDAHGCPAALWNQSATAPTAATATEAKVAPPPEAPPSSGEGGGAAHCAVDDEPLPGLPLALGLFALGLLDRRRRRRRS